MSEGIDDISVEIGDDLVAIVEWHRPPNNHFDADLIRVLADELEKLDSGTICRAVVLCSEGKHFCAGADFSSGRGFGETVRGADNGKHLYDEALRLFSIKVPLIAAVQGSAIGGGLGLAMSADFRVASPDSRFSANFARLGFHHGFGLTVTLPAAIGQQKALEMLYTGRRVVGEDAFSIGLCDRLVAPGSIRTEARALAAEIAASAPLAVRAIRETMRADLVARVRIATEREKVEQERLSVTLDFKEGLRATAGRETPRFTGQ